MFCLRKLLSLLAEKRLNRRREETCMKPVKPLSEPGRAPSQLQKSLFPTPNKALTDPKHGTYEAKTTYLRLLSMVFTSRCLLNYIPMLLEFHPPMDWW